LKGEKSPIQAFPALETREKKPRIFEFLLFNHDFGKGPLKSTNFPLKSARSPVEGHALQTGSLQTGPRAHIDN